MLGTRTPRTEASVNSGLSTANQLDAELFDVMYGQRAHELVTFFYRRTRNADAAAELLAETFAVGVLLRRNNPELSAQDAEWLRSIAKLELSRYFRKLAVELDAVRRLDMEVPRLTETEVLVLDVEIHEDRHARLGG